MSQLYTSNYNYLNRGSGYCPNQSRRSSYYGSASTQCTCPSYYSGYRPYYHNCYQYQTYTPQNQGWSEYIPVDRSYTEYIPEYRVEYTPVQHNVVDYQEIRHEIDYIPRTTYEPVQTSYYAGEVSGPRSSYYLPSRSQSLRGSRILY